RAAWWSRASCRRRTARIRCTARSSSSRSTRRPAARPASTTCCADWRTERPASRHVGDAEWPGGRICGRRRTRLARIEQEDGMTTLYGLKNCDTCRKATKWLARFGIAHTFVDYRDSKPSPETLVEWAGKLGGFAAMVNKSSTTWRQLPDNRKAAASDAEWKLLLQSGRA